MSQRNNFNLQNSESKLTDVADALQKFLKHEARPWRIAGMMRTPQIAVVFLSQLETD